VHDEAQALAQARDQGSPLLIDFGADWCLPCKELENQVFSDPSVYAEVTARYVPLKFDVSKDNDVDRAAKARWGAETLPTVILAGPDGKERKRFTEPIPTADEMLKALRAIE
jgi:thiol:disulfide interchange protein DsbD